MLHNLLDVAFFFGTATFIFLYHALKVSHWYTAKFVPNGTLMVNGKILRIIQYYWTQYL